MVVVRSMSNSTLTLSIHIVRGLQYVVLSLSCIRCAAVYSCTAAHCIQANPSSVRLSFGSDQIQHWSCWYISATSSSMFSCLLYSPCRFRRLETVITWSESIHKGRLQKYVVLTPSLPRPLLSAFGITFSACGGLKLCSSKLMLPTLHPPICVDVLYGWALMQKKCIIGHC